MLTPFSIDEVRLMERKTLYQVRTKCGNDKTFYRFGFNGKEQDPEFKGKHNVQEYGFRMNDTRYGRFFTTDPLKYKYHNLTPYQFASNSPISGIDLDGLELMNYGTSMLRQVYLGTTEIMGNNVLNIKVVSICENIPSVIKYEAADGSCSVKYVHTLIDSEGNKLSNQTQISYSSIPEYKQSQWGQSLSPREETNDEGQQFPNHPESNTLRGKEKSLFDKTIGAIGSNLAHIIDFYEDNIKNPKIWGALYDFEKNQELFRKASSYSKGVSGLPSNIDNPQGRVALTNYILDGSLTPLDDIIGSPKQKIEYQKSIVESAKTILEMTHNPINESTEQDVRNINESLNNLKKSNEN